MLPFFGASRDVCSGLWDGPVPGHATPHALRRSSYRDSRESTTQFADARDGSELKKSGLRGFEWVICGCFGRAT